MDTNISWCLLNSAHSTIPGCPVNFPIYGLDTDVDGNHNIMSDVKFQLQKYDWIPIFNVSIPLIPFNFVVRLIVIILID